jgi:hypothetical protein
MGVFGLRHFLENFDLGLDVGSVLFVPPTSSVQGALCLVDGVLPPLALTSARGTLVVWVYGRFAPRAVIP